MGRIGGIVGTGSGFIEFYRARNVYMNASVLGLSNQEIECALR